MRLEETSGWGRHPRIDAAILRPLTSSQAGRQVVETLSLLARGMGRSYGDSALAPHLQNLRGLDHLLAFDEASGTLTCEAGTLLADVLEVFVPRGWFLPVTPGTRFVTVGGAIACDVHGKNHHRDGCFSAFVENFDLLSASGESIRCSRGEHADLFHATCGGMGLTGIIVAATLKLRRIGSAFVRQTTFKAANLDEALDRFDAESATTYSVAWIDCLQRGRGMGRSLVMLGEHADDGDYAMAHKRPMSLPVDLPDFALNHYSIAAFNTLYYHRIQARESTARVHYEPYFYPLDGLLHWNRMYGKRGFAQYQFVIPKAAGRDALKAMLAKIADSGRGSFLAVLKTCGPGNDNPLSFPVEGWSLALDFKADDGLWPLLDELDAMLLAAGGRLYLTKDCRMSEQTFKQSYPRWREFQQIRARYGALGKFASLQSQRLGLE
jgi:FAD/FMN-containing dehydrogenase